MQKLAAAHMALGLHAPFGVSVTYRRLYSVVLDGIIPAERDATGSRWVINISDLPAIADAMKSR